MRVLPTKVDDWYHSIEMFSTLMLFGALKWIVMDSKWKNRCPWPPVARVDWQSQINVMCLLLNYVSQIQSYWRKVVNATVSSKQGLGLEIPVKVSTLLQLRLSSKHFQIRKNHYELILWYLHSGMRCSVLPGMVCSLYPGLRCSMGRNLHIVHTNHFTNILVLNDWGFLIT